MQITYKNWAFRFTVWIIIINIAAFWMTLHYNSLLYDQSQVIKKVWLLSLLGNLLLVGIILFLILSIVKKEKRNYKFWISLLVSVLLILNIIISVIGFLT